MRDGRNLSLLMGGPIIITAQPMIRVGSLTAGTTDLM
jgi:hypothetical protein